MGKRLSKIPKKSPIIPGAEVPTGATALPYTSRGASAGRAWGANIFIESRELCVTKPGQREHR